MNNDKFDKMLRDARSAFADMPDEEIVITRMMFLGLTPAHAVEMRLMSDKDEGHIAFARRAVTAFFLAFQLPPSHLVVHPTVAALIEVAEVILLPDEKFAVTIYKQKKPPKIEADEDLPLNTVVVKFVIGDLSLYRPAFASMFLKMLKDNKANDAQH